MVRKLPTKSQAIYEISKMRRNKKMSGKRTSVKYGCAEAVNEIVYQATGEEIGGDVSTYRMYMALQDKSRFLKVPAPIAGDIVISPTGYGSGVMLNGHVGILGENDKIFSNTSATGKWTENYTKESWKARYVDKGGFPMEYYKMI